MSDQEWAYIARTTKISKRHPIIGTVVCTAVDRPEYRKDNAKLVAEWMRDGLIIERVPVEWVRKHFATAEPFTLETAS